jgi:hypothetical protein
VWRLNPVSTYSIASAYAWIFVIAATLSTFGLTVAGELVGRRAGQWSAFVDIAVDNIRWSLGPALLSVYVNHYLDRQTDPRLPNIGEDASVLWRAGYALLFTLVVQFLTLPSIPTIHAREGAVWPDAKLRVIAMGTVFCITLALSLVAQFGLAKRSGNSASVQTARQTSRIRLS